VKNSSTALVLGSKESCSLKPNSPEGGWATNADEMIKIRDSAEVESMRPGFLATLTEPPWRRTLFGARTSG
jgi:hypothetical protein